MPPGCAERASARTPVLLGIPGAWLLIGVALNLGLGYAQAAARQP